MKIEVDSEAMATVQGCGEGLGEDSCCQDCSFESRSDEEHPGAPGSSQELVIAHTALSASQLQVIETSYKLGEQDSGSPRQP